MIVLTLPIRVKLTSAELHGQRSTRNNWYAGPWKYLTGEQMVLELQQNLALGPRVVERAGECI